MEAVDIAQPCIKPIDKTTVNKICSGQVVLTLATAVKELLENSLDAGANTIKIRLKDYGSTLIEVSDNGHGVKSENFSGLTLKHYTSKISEFQDLESVDTFGFRGEALSSLCALGNMSVCTRHRYDTVGTKLVFDHNGAIKETSGIARQVGTSVFIENLFSTLPVRHKEFLRNIKREFGKLVNVLQAYGLLHHDCSITCINQIGNKTRQVLGTRIGSMRENIISIFGPKQMSTLLEIQTVAPDEEVRIEFRCRETSQVTLSGFISSCAHGAGRSSPDHQFVYINNRPVDSPKITRLVNEIYHQYNPHQQPFVVINIAVAANSVDVNVVPDKRLIMLENEGLVLATIKSSLLNLYLAIPSTIPLNLGKLSTILDTFRPPQEKDEDADSGDLISRPARDLTQFMAKGATHLIQQTQEAKKRQLGLTEFLTKKRNLLREVDTEESVAKRNKLEAGENIVKGKVRVISMQILPTIIDKTEQVNQFHKVDERSSSSDSDISLNIAQIDQKTNSVINDKDVMESSSIITVPKKADIYQGGQKTSFPFMVEEQEARTRSVDNSDLLQNNLSERFEDNIVVKPYELRREESADEGITEEERKGRRRVDTCVSVEEIKKMRLKLKQNSKKTAPSVKFFAKIEPAANDRAEDELRKELSQKAFTSMQILGQFNRGFIITRLESDLFIIDQHATDEKANFEALSQKKVGSQRLTVPQSLHLDSATEELLLDRGDIIRANGFAFTVDESAPMTQRVSLIAAPVFRGVTLDHRDLDELLFLLADAPEGQICRPSRVRDLLASKACRMSVMVGTALNLAQMRRLVHRMGDLQQPWNCPHGRPTIRHLLSLELLASS